MFLIRVKGRRETGGKDTVRRRGGHVPVFYEGAVLVVAAGRKGKDSPAQAYEASGLACKADSPLAVISIEKRTDAERISGCKEGAGSFDRTEQEQTLRLSKTEHAGSVFFIQRQEKFTVAAALNSHPSLIRASRTGRNPYSSPLQVTQSAPRKKGCMPRASGP